MQPSAFKTVALRLSQNLFWRSKLIPCARKQGVIMREKMQEPRHFPHVNPCLSFFFFSPPKPLCCSNILFQYTCLPSSLPQHHWLCVLVTPLCHYVSTLRTRAPLSYKFCRVELSQGSVIAAYPQAISGLTMLTAAIEM